MGFHFFPIRVWGSAWRPFRPTELCYERGCMDLVDILMDPVHGPGPQRGPWTRGPCFIFSHKLKHSCCSLTFRDWSLCSPWGLHLRNCFTFLHCDLTIQSGFILIPSTADKVKINVCRGLLVSFQGTIIHLSVYKH